MRFIDRRPSGTLQLVVIAATTALGACSVRTPPPGPATAPAPGPTTTTRPPVSVAPANVHRARHWDEYRRLAAERMVAANPTSTYIGVPPEPLLAIPVLEVELQADGSIARITVQRQPSQARDTVKLAMDAVHRAAPFGPVSHLPKPWKFSEVFLFDDNRRFKPRSLD